MKECKVCHNNYLKNGFQSDFKFITDVMKSFGNFAVITANNVGYRFFMFDMTEDDGIEFIKDLNTMNYNSVTV